MTPCLKSWFWRTKREVIASLLPGWNQGHWSLLLLAFLNAFVKYTWRKIVFKLERWLTSEAYYRQYQINSFQFNTLNLSNHWYWKIFLPLWSVGPKLKSNDSLAMHGNHENKALYESGHKKFKTNGIVLCPCCLEQSKTDCLVIIMLFWMQVSIMQMRGCVVCELITVHIKLSHSFFLSLSGHFGPEQLPPYFYFVCIIETPRKTRPQISC
jgi:hypothetical protein